MFKPYAGVSTAILLFTKTNSGGTDHVWFYDLQADGYSLDDKRTPLLADDKLGARRRALTDEEHAKNNLPDALARWRERDGDELRPGPHRPELLRPEGRHRRQRLRPQHQPLQGDRPRRDRAPPPRRDPRRPRASSRTRSRRASTDLEAML